MNLEMDAGSSPRYKSRTQRVRFLTENWVHANVLCPGCTGQLKRYANNSPVADFSCPVCSEDFELKATSGKIGKIIPDGAYSTMIERLSSRRNPNLLLLQYDAGSLSVTNLAAIPKYYFATGIIKIRPPLSPTARRAGWVGCNILIGEIPRAGRIKIVTDRVVEPLEQIMSDWKRTSFLQEVRSDQAKGWLLETMRCIDRIDKSEFELSDIYQFERSLRVVYPNNSHIREKLRQQLQVLRDRGYIRFVGYGVYALA